MDMLTRSCVSDWEHQIQQFAVHGAALQHRMSWTELLPDGGACRQQALGGIALPARLWAACACKDSTGTFVSV